MKAATINWQFVRAPDEVPTPVAIALADFCRRAGAPASADEVRTALALLSEVDDARVRALADSEPPARPLGPLAVIDLLGGTPASTAAERQRWGVYIGELEKLGPPPSHSKAPAFRAAAAKPPVAEVRAVARQRDSKKPQRAQTVAEKIAPKRRTPAAEPAPEETEPTAPSANSALPKRQLPAPRGRFVRLNT